MAALIKDLLFNKTYLVVSLSFLFSPSAVGSTLLAESVLLTEITVTVENSKN